MSHKRANIKKRYLVFYFLKNGLVWQLILLFILTISDYTYGQYDLSLSQTVNAQKVNIGDTLTYSLSLTHEDGLIAENIIIKDTLSKGLRLLPSSNFTNGDTVLFDTTTNIISWFPKELSSVNNQANLTFNAVVLQSGLIRSKAEVFFAPDDMDSKAANNSQTEDDESTIYVSVPLQLCAGTQNIIELEVDINQESIRWYTLAAYTENSDINLADTTLAGIGKKITISSPGIYLPLDNFNNCYANDCTPIFVEENCCDQITSTPLMIHNICQGESVQIGTNYNNSVNYKWVPSYGLDDQFAATPIANPAVSTTYIVEISARDAACMYYDTVRVNVFDVPNPDFRATRVCQGEMTIFEDATVTYTNLTNWVWDFGDGKSLSNEQNPSHLYEEAGTYAVKLIVTSTNNCQDSITKNVIVNPIVQVLTTAQKDTLCLGECIGLTAQGGITYTWTPTATLDNPNSAFPLACPTETTTYYLEATNDFDCISKDSITITVLPPPTIALEMSNITSCGAADGIITIDANGLASNYQYSIDGGLTYHTTNVFNHLPASSYMVSIKRGGCEVAYPNNPVRIGEGQSPTITSVSTNNPTCSANNGHITIEANGGINSVYSIDGGLNWVANNEFTGLAGGRYYIAIANSDLSCVSYHPPVTLVQPVAPFFSDIRFTQPSDCGKKDGTITIIATGSTSIEYGLNNGLTTIWQSSNQFINLPAGHYEGFVRNIGNTCVTASSFAPIQLETLTAPIIETVTINSPSDCGERDAQITIIANGNSDLEYSIDGGFNWQNLAVFNNLNPDTYNVLVRNQGGTCPVAYDNNPIEIDIPESLKILNVVTVNPTDCGVENGQIAITTKETLKNLIYSIDAGNNWQMDSLFTGLSGGTYAIQVAHSDTTCKITYPTLTLTQPQSGIIKEVMTVAGCQEGEGSINIIAESQTLLAYSIDGGTTYQSSNNFMNLAYGNYEVRIRNNTGNCEIIYTGNPILLQPPTNPDNGIYIDNIDAFEPTTCGAMDGFIDINAIGENILYSFDGGINFSEQSSFDNIGPGIYNIVIKNELTGCEINYFRNPIELLTIPNPDITNIIQSNPTDCRANDGFITIEASGEGGLQYSLDGSNWSYENTYLNLLPGLYNAWVRYEDESCAIPYFNNPIIIEGLKEPKIIDCVGSNPTDCDVNDGIITVIATGGNSTLKYSIDGGSTWQNENQFTDLAAGIYEVVVANEAETCQVVHPICVLTAPQPPIINEVLKVHPSACMINNGSITILAEGHSSLEYSIDGGTTFSGNSFFGNLAAMDYEIIVRNAADNCNITFGTVTLEATTAPLIVSGIDDAATCRGNFVPVSISISEAITQYTILGSGGYLNASIVDSTLTFDAYLNGVADKFTVNLENAAGCSVVETFTIFQAGNPEADFIIQQPICAATDVLIEFKGTANPNAILTWDLAGGNIISTSTPTSTSPAGATLVVQWPSAGGKTIRLKVNDGGCIDEKVQNINVNKQPFANAGTDITICKGECFQLNGLGNGSLYQWSPAIGLSTTTIPNPLVCPPVTTTYQLLVMSAEGCMVMDEMTITVADELIVNVGPDQNINQGEQIQLTANGGVVYEWMPSTGLSNPTIAAPFATPQTTTTYTVKVTNEAGCIETDEIVINVLPNDSKPLEPCSVNLIDEESQIVKAIDCFLNTKVCLPIPLADFLNYTLTDNGITYTNGLVGCQIDTQLAYTYYTIPDLGTKGPYQVMSWKINGITYSGMFNSLAELVNKMNEWDTTGHWEIESTGLIIKGGNSNTVYSRLIVEQLHTGALAIMELNSNLVPKGTNIELNAGTHKLIITNELTGCSDQLIVNIVCSEEETNALLPSIDEIITTKDKVTVEKRTIFTVFKTRQQIDLQWLTNLNNEIKSFEVEHSPDGVEFRLIRKVENYAVSEELESFNIIDSQPILGTNFYRIKQNYHNGNFTYSAIKAVDFNVDLDKISIFPNPAHEELFISLPNLDLKYMTISVQNQYGQKIYTEDFNEIIGELIRLDISTFHDGMYFIVIKKQNKRIYSKKLIISKL